ncbi:MAG: helix-turn-helix transcriptional regulator [Phycisphaerae bacterium]|jgi:hypothetical protein
MCEMTHDVDLAEKSKEFASRMRAAQKKLDYSWVELARLTDISKPRLKELMGGKAIFKASELQVLGIVFGIAFDHLFPLAMSKQKVHRVFSQLVADGVGLIAPAAGAPRRKVPRQEVFERSIVQLHHCAECLCAFPQ